MIFSNTTNNGLFYAYFYFASGEVRGFRVAHSA